MARSIFFSTKPKLNARLRTPVRTTGLFERKTNALKRIDYTFALPYDSPNQEKCV